MSKHIPFFMKFTLAGLIFAIVLVAVPAASASAAGLPNGPTPTTSQPANNVRLENVWARLQAVYQRQGIRLARTDEFLEIAQTLIDKANQKGWDTSAVQAALDAFAAVIPDAKAAHNLGAPIIAGHNGFNAVGKVIDRDAAVETVGSLGQVIKNTRTAMNGTGRALREAVRDFRAAHRPAPTPATP